jgi:hypothetical protein
MAVRSREAFVTVTGEFATRLAFALPVGTTDVRGDIPHPFRCVIGCHGHGAAVNHCKTGSGSDHSHGLTDTALLSKGLMPHLPY